MIFHVYRLELLHALSLSFSCRVLSTDGIIESVKRRRYYEKPCRKRERKSYENCKRIYNTEMARKISFISRTQRQDPWQGC